MFDMGFFELIIVAALGLLVLGPTRLPRLARAVGHWVGVAKGFSQGIKEELVRESNLQDVRAELTSTMVDNTTDNSTEERVKADKEA